MIFAFFVPEVAITGVNKVASCVLISFAVGGGIILSKPIRPFC
jgi:hypothetical protein